MPDYEKLYYYLFNRITDALAQLDEIANGIYMLGKNYVPVVTVDHSYVPEHRQDS